MSLSNKYNIPKETVDKMVQDGFLSCSIPKYEEIYDMYQKGMKEPGAVKHRVELMVAAKTGYSERQVRYIIAKFK